MRLRAFLSLPAALAALAAAPAAAADLSCAGLVPSGRTMICAGFEPNWAISLQCTGATMTSTFIDAFSGAGISEMPGTVTFSSHDPRTFETSHPVTGSIAATPGGCTDAAGRAHDFTFTPTAAPGLSGDLLRPFCCRVE